MNIEVFTTLSQEHEMLLPLLLDIQSAAEAADIPALVEKLTAGRQALTTELDAHIALEDDSAFVSVEEVLGKEVALPFRVDLLVVLQGQLRIEFAHPDFPPYLLQPGDVLVLPARTACRA